MEEALKTIFWVSAGLMLYTYLAYPASLFVFAAIRQAASDLRFALARRERRQRALTGAIPSVSLIFSAYNEEAVMAAKMANCFQLDYPLDRLEILVGCDGCSDRTAELARAANLPNARIYDFAERSGKLSVLNRLADQARGEIVVFSDASTLLDASAIRLLLRHFDNPHIGCAIGEMRLVDTNGTLRPEGVYWKYEVFLKFLESRLGILLGASGCIYAIRKHLYRSIPAHGINEDFLIPLYVREAKYRLVYDPEAFGCEHAVEPEQDFRRHVRIGAGNYLALMNTARLLMPLAGPVCFSYWSHKVLRWLVPFALLALFLSSAALLHEWLYLTAFAAIVALCLAAVAARVLEKQGHLSRFLSLARYFLLMNFALFLGFIRFLRGEQTPVWETRGTARSGLATAVKKAAVGE